VKLAGRIPVEPLDEERLTKIERRIVAGAVDAASRAHGSRAPRRHLGRVLAAVAMVAAGFVGWTLHGAPASGPVVAEPAPIRVQTELSRTLLDLGDARIESDPATVFAVTRPAGGVLVAMTRGKVELEVGERGTRPPLIVRAGETDVIVVGTHFTVDYGDGHGGVDVRVTEGVVRVVHHQQETRVAAGQAWQTQAGLVARADREAGRSQAAHPRLSDDDGDDGDGDGDVAGDRGPAHGSDGAAIAGGQAPEVLHGHKAAVPDASGATAALPPRDAMAPAPARPVSGESVRSHVVPRPRDPHVDLRSAIRAQHVEAALDLGEPNAASAVAKYYEIAAHKSGEEASQAFYSIAVLRHLRLARNADALQTLDAYVRRFPGGKQYRAVLWLRVRILCLDKLDDRCRAAAYTYLHEAPDGPAARVAELLTLSE
jgi:hypothetical protein